MRRELMAGDRDDAVWEFDDVLLVIPKKHHQIKTLNPPPRFQESYQDHSHQDYK